MGFTWNVGGVYRLPLDVYRVRLLRFGKLSRESFMGQSRKTATGQRQTPNVQRQTINVQRQTGNGQRSTSNAPSFHVKHHHPYLLRFTTSITRFWRSLGETPGMRPAWPR